MLHENLTSEDLDVGISETENIPYVINANRSLKFQKYRTFPEVAWRSFWIRNDKGKRVDLIVRPLLIPEYEKFILMSSEPDIKLDNSHMFEVFDKLNKEIEGLFGVEGSIIDCFKPVSDLFCEWHQKKFPNMQLVNRPCFSYYMSEEQRTRLLEDTKDGIPLPEGYYWDEADPEKDAKIMFETWKLAGPGDYEGMKAKIRNLPSAMIRVKETGEPAAFEVVNPIGSLSHQFTQPAHRRKGLGAAVEKQICVKLIKKGMVPCKNVEDDNLNVIKSSDKNPYWTKKADSEVQS